MTINHSCRPTMEVRKYGGFAARAWSTLGGLEICFHSVRAKHRHDEWAIQAANASSAGETDAALTHGISKKGGRCAGRPGEQVWDTLLVDTTERATLAIEIESAHRRAARARFATTPILRGLLLADRAVSGNSALEDGTG